MNDGGVKLASIRNHMVRVLFMVEGMYLIVESNAATLGDLMYLFYFILAGLVLSMMTCA